MDKIIFICTGNTCRSPMAEGFWKALGAEQKLCLEAQSAGLFTQDGIPVTENAVTAAKELGADIADHTSRMLTPELAMEARYLVCMTGAHYDRLLEAYPKYEDKIFTISPKDIADPFGGDMTVYRVSAEQIKDAVMQLASQLEKRL